MEYKGYTARVEFDESANVFHGQVLDLRDVVTFEATNVEDLWKDFRESVDDYLEFCAERGEEPEKPFSGKFLVRIDPAQHRAAVVAAGKRGVSLNAWITEAIFRALAPAVDARAFFEDTFTDVIRSVLRKETRIPIAPTHNQQAQLIYANSFGTPHAATGNRWAHLVTTTIRTAHEPPEC